MALGDFLFPRAKMKLIITRCLETDIESVKNKFSKEYMDTAAIVHLNIKDMNRLSLKENGTVNLKSAAGSIIVRAKPSSKTDQGRAIMPLSPWALALVSVPDDDSPPMLHGIDITVTRSEEEVTTPELLLNP